VLLGWDLFEGGRAGYERIGFGGEKRLVCEARSGRTLLLEERIQGKA